MLSAFWSSSYLNFSLILDNISPILLFPLQAIVFYKFGIMDQPFSRVNVHCVVARLLCWFLLKLHQGSAKVLKCLMFLQELKLITVYLVSTALDFFRYLVCPCCILSLTLRFLNIFARWSCSCLRSTMQNYVHWAIVDTTCFKLTHSLYK